MVVAKLAERSPPTPEDRDSNPVIGKFFNRHFSLSVNFIRKDKNKEKEAGGKCPFKTLIQHFGDL